MFDEFAKAIQSANGTGSDIYRNFSASKINASPAASAGKKAAVQANVDEQQRVAGIDAKNKKDQLDQKFENDAKDPSKAQMVMRSDHSGYDFFDGAGKPMNINSFSLLTGKRPDELLADSSNPRDQKFVQDYKTMRDLSNAWVNGDNQTLAKYRAADPQKFNEIVTQYKSPQDMVQGFMNHYSDYYSTTQNAQTADTPSFSPSNLYDPSQLSKPDQQRLGGATLAQTTAPVTIAPPTAPGGIPGFIQEHADPLGLSQYQQHKKSYEDYIKSNPWAWYNSQLMGH